MPEVHRIPCPPFSYSSAVIAGDLVFLDLHRGVGSDFSDQLADVMNNVRVTLNKCGLSLHYLVKVSVWLKYIEDLSTMEQAFFDWYPTGGFPARITSTTEFCDEDCLVMIEDVACRDASV